VTGHGVWLVGMPGYTRSGRPAAPVSTGVAGGVVVVVLVLVWGIWGWGRAGWWGLSVVWGVVWECVVLGWPPAVVFGLVMCLVFLWFGLVWLYCLGVGWVFFWVVRFLCTSPFALSLGTLSVVGECAGPRGLGR